MEPKQQAHWSLHKLSTKPSSTSKTPQQHLGATPNQGIQPSPCLASLQPSSKVLQNILKPFGDDTTQAHTLQWPY